MANVNNLFSGVVTFFVAIGFVYMIHPNVVSMASEMPEEVKIFILIIWMVLAMLMVMGLPFLMVTSASSDNP